VIKQKLITTITLHSVPVGYSNTLHGFKRFAQTRFAEILSLNFKFSAKDLILLKFLPGIRR